MTALGARRLALTGVAVAVVAVVVGVGVAVSGPGTPSGPSSARTASPPSSSPVASAPAPVSPSPTRTAPVALPRPQPPKVRLAGDDVYAISAAASRAAFPGGARAPVVYLVSGESLAEGYGAVPAAAIGGGPVLLSRPDGIPKVTATELERLHPRRIVLVGGTSVLSDAVARAAARRAATVDRVDGAGADGTSIALARGAFPTARTAWVVAGNRPEHAVVASVAAAATRAPLLALDAGATVLPAAHADLLRDLGVTSVTVVGGPDAVSASAVAGLEDVVGDGNVARAGGGDRYEVAAEVDAITRPGRSAGVAYLANGRAVATAFAGASLAGLSQRPLHYALPYCVPPATRAALTTRSVSRVVLVGGERTVRRLAGRLEPCRSLTDADSTWVLVNRRNPVSPVRAAPADLTDPAMANTQGHQLRREAAAALTDMASDVAGASGRIGIDTAYRSYATQDALYDRWLARRGRTWTDTWYARPGYSEHQTGLTVDLLPIGAANCSINDCIDETPQGRWLARNSWRYGYILRYERGYRSVVGLGFEPWHFRYVGPALARAYHEGGWHTLEAFLDEPAAPAY